MASLLSSLPPLPPKMARLPVDPRGYPVPWFVTWLDAKGKPTRRGQGTPDFRVVTPAAKISAHVLSLCWICGETLGRYRTFVIGPMCAINRLCSEPPSHLECADFAARACPFLVHPQQRRRQAGMPEGHSEAPGVMILRNPGVTLVWTTTRSRPRLADGGYLYILGDPEHVRWYTEGRKATRAEVQASLDSGFPLLHRETRDDAERSELARALQAAELLLPPESLT